MDNVLVQLMDVFNWVIQSSVYAVVAIAIIALVQFAGRRRFPARWLYALWLILLIRLILPAGPESRLSLWSFLPQAVMQNSFVSSAETSNSGSYVPIYRRGNDGAVGENAAASLPSQRTREINAHEALSILWLAGTLIVIAGIAASNFRLWRSVRKLRQATDQSLLELFEDCKQSMRVRTIVGLVITDQVKSPSLFGCIRPRVLLPSGLVEQIPREELRFIFLHELAHLKQKDIWVGWIAALVQSVHWFNPLVWWAFARMRADREVACDALALSRLENEDSDRYGGALIGLLERFHHSRRLPVVAGILENKAQLKRRLNMITNFRHSTRREIVAAAALLAVLSITLLTNPRTLLSQSDEWTDEAPKANMIGEFRLAPDQDGLSVREFRLAPDGEVVTRIAPKVVYRIEDDTLSQPPLPIGGEVLQSMLIHRVAPIYPEAAKSERVFGTVELTVTVNEEGVVTEIAVAGGHPLLIMAAVDAVRQWLYTPVTRDGVPIPIISAVRVNFALM